MVEPTSALDPHRVEELLDDGRAGQGHAEGAPRLHDESQVLEVEVDLEPWIVGPRHVVRCLLFEALGAGQAAPEGLQGERAIEARLLGERQRLAERGQVDRYDDLIGELGEPARADRYQVGDRLSERLEYRKRGLEVGLLTSDHDAEGGVDRAFLTAGHRRLQHADTLLAQSLADFLRDERRDRGHVDEEQTLL